MEVLQQQIDSKLVDNFPSLYYKTFFDNVVSAYGKCFDAMWNQLPVEQKKAYLNSWVVNLPLKSDKKEGFLMNKLLIKLLNSQDLLLVLGDNCQHFEQIIGCFRKSYKDEVLSNSELDDEIAKVINF